MVFQLAATALLALYASTVSAVNPLIVQGTDLVDSVTKARFDIIGVAYQPGGSAGYKPDSKIDPLSNGTACLRDATLLQSLGANTIRVYNLDPTINHDDCASIFNSAGIYMILDVNSPLPNESIDASNPASSYSGVYLNRIFSVVEAFKDYPNVLGFFGGNEIINDDTTGGVDPPFIRAVTRDLKNYIAKHSTRPIPVGYSAADVRDILLDTYSYTSCAINGDSTDMSRVDFFGLNSYSWCGQSNAQTAGYDILVSDFTNATSPVFFSEYGCNKVAPRVFTEVGAIYTAPMSTVMSGGMAYQFTQDTNNFGLVTLNNNGTASLLVDFDNLQKQLNHIDIKGLAAINSSATSVTPPKCDSSLISSTTFFSSFTIPDIPSGGQDLVDNGVASPSNGKLVQVTNAIPAMMVYGSNGIPIQGLKLKILSNDGSNVPGGKSTSGNPATASGTTSGTAPSASSSATGGAVKIERGGVAALAFIGALAVAVL